MKQIELGNSGVFLHELSPRVSPKYSPKLHNWLRRNVDVLHVVYVATDWHGNIQICMGETDEKWPFTCQLMDILCNGSEARFCAVAGMTKERLPELEGFWQRYKAAGRCAIDPDHDMDFINSERWRYSDDRQRRTCRWCGKVAQRLVKTERIVVDETWKTLEVDR